MLEVTRCEFTSGDRVDFLNNMTEHVLFVA